MNTYYLYKRTCFLPKSETSKQLYKIYLFFKPEKLRQHFKCLRCILKDRCSFAFFYLFQKMDKTQRQKIRNLNLKGLLPF